MSSDKRDNGHDAPAVEVLPELVEVSPVRPRPVLRRVDIPADDPQPMALRKVVESQFTQLARLNEIDKDLVSLGTATVTSFVRVDRRLDLMDDKLDERFTELNKALGLARRAKLDSHSALEEVEGVKSEVADLRDDLEERTSPGFDRTTGKVVTREELELRELRARLEASEATRLEMAKAAQKLDADAADVKRARRTALYAFVGSATLALLVAIVGILWGLAKAQSAHDAGVLEGREQRPALVAPAPEPKRP